MLKGKLTYVTAVALGLQLVAQLLGVDVAPTEVDALVAAGTVALNIYGRWRATR